jgi:asparagine synthase (glutamine-hydrolysing)
MPPIFGILNLKKQPPDPEMINRMKGEAKYIKPRMVESVEIEGGYVGTAVVTENPLIPAHDAFSMNEPWVVVADACLYKREELAGKLGRDLDSTRSTELQHKRTDAALILDAWLKLGRDCVKHLYGDFAFVIFNTHTGEVFCGRDHLGVRPLFYSIREDYFIFASELRVVLAAFPEKPELSEDYLLDTLVTVKTKKDLSPYHQINRLIPAHSLHCLEGRSEIEEYWHAGIERSIRFSDEAEYIALFREKLMNAVNMRCEEVPVLAAELSGGLDSSAITGIATDYVDRFNGRLLAFSNIYPVDTGVDFKDEQEFIAAMRSWKQLDWIGVDSLHTSIPGTLQHTLNIHRCFIQQNFNIFNRALYQAAGERKAQVLFSGFGGDELVSTRTAMPWSELIDDRQWRVILDEIYYKGISLKSLIKPALIAARYFRSKLERAEYTSGIFTPELLDKRMANLPLWPEFAKKQDLGKRMADKYKRRKRSNISMRQIDRIMLDHLPQRMEYCYAAAAQYGIEYRYPLLDLDLVETCLAFPPWLKQHHGINRYAFRQAIKDFVPEKIRQRDDKSGTTIPHMYYSLVKEKDQILDLVNSCKDNVRINEMMDLSKFPEWYDRLVKRDKKEMNYLNPGAFYDYLMILMYFKEDLKTCPSGQAGGCIG